MSEELRVKMLGRRGMIPEMMKSLADCPDKATRVKIGKFCLAAKAFLNEECDRETERINLLVETRKSIAETLGEVRGEWSAYKAFLMKKHPAPEGSPWHFTCDHHKAIDKLLDNKVRCAICDKVVTCPEDLLEHAACFEEAKVVDVR